MINIALISDQYNIIENYMKEVKNLWNIKFIPVMSEINLCSQRFDGYIVLDHENKDKITKLVGTIMMLNINIK